MEMGEAGEGQLIIGRKPVLELILVEPERVDAVFVRDGARSREQGEILDAWGDRIVMQRRIPDALSDDMGNQTYTARVRTEDELRDFVSFVQEQR